MPTPAMSLNSLYPRKFPSTLNLSFPKDKVRPRLYEPSSPNMWIASWKNNIKLTAVIPWTFITPGPLHLLAQSAGKMGAFLLIGRGGNNETRESGRLMWAVPAPTSIPGHIPKQAN